MMACFQFYHWHGVRVVLSEFLILLVMLPNLLGELQARERETLSQKTKWSQSWETLEVVLQP